MTSTAILSPLSRAPIADTETGVPRVQNSKTDMTTKGEEKNAPQKPSSTSETKLSPNATVRRTTIDWETGSVVFRVIDEHSGTTVSQSPDEALLRLRAYARQNELDLQTDTKGGSSAQSRTPPSSAPKDQTASAPLQPASPPFGIVTRPAKTV